VLDPRKRRENRTDHSDRQTRPVDMGWSNQMKEDFKDLVILLVVIGAISVAIVFVLNASHKDTKYKVVTSDGKEYRNLSPRSYGTFIDETNRKYRFEGSYTVIEELE
jgi:hypothetical protein